MFVREIDEVLDERFEKNVTIGAEMEIYIIDAYEDRYALLDDSDVLENIYYEFDERVFRDYYEYQLEVRTNPSDDWKVVASELIELIRRASKVAKEHQCIIAPVSYVEGGVFNGFHVHIGFRPDVNFEKKLKFIYAIYPFVYDVSRLTLSSPWRNNSMGEILSRRIVESRHIGVIPIESSLDYFKDLWLSEEKDRYYDVIVNSNFREGRHRIKDVETVEIRMFDCVGSERYIKTLLQAVYKIARYVNIDWFGKYMNDYDLLVRVKRLYESYRLLLVKDWYWINPITLTPLNTLLTYLECDYVYDYPWIYRVDVPLRDLYKPYEHKYIDYPIP